MIDFLNQALSGFQAMSGWEYLAVVLSVTYLVLAMRQSLWCWPAAFASTFIYTALFYNGALLMDSLLNVYYMVMAVYGWYFWRYGKQKPDSDNLPIESWPLSKHFNYSICTLVVALVLGYMMDNHTRADFAYLDSLTTCFSLLATYLVVKKVLENWLYWIVIDAVSMYLYVNKGFYPTTILFGLYTVLAIWGYMQWQQAYEQEELVTAS